MAKAKDVPPEHLAAGQRLKELRVRYGWRRARILADHARISAVELGRSTLSGDLVDAYSKVFRIDGRTVADYRDGLISVDEFIVRAGVKPGDGAAIPASDHAPDPMPAPRSLPPWDHDDVEELLILTLVARGIPRLLANGVVRSERYKLREYPDWALRIAHLEAVCEAEAEDARLPRRRVHGAFAESAEGSATPAPTRSTKTKARKAGEALASRRSKTPKH